MPLLEASVVTTEARRVRTMKKAKSPVSKKVSHLVKEGASQKKAVATALSMKKAGRLTKGGGYKPVAKKAKGSGY